MEKCIKIPCFIAPNSAQVTYHICEKSTYSLKVICLSTVLPLLIVTYVRYIDKDPNFLRVYKSAHTTTIYTLIMEKVSTIAE